MVINPGDLFRGRYTFCKNRRVVCVCGFQIDGSGGHYKLFADGTLQIVGLYRSDSGLYICMANNGVGDPIRKEVYLTVRGESRIIFSLIFFFVSPTPPLPDNVCSVAAGVSDIGFLTRRGIIIIYYSILLSVAVILIFFF